jgi:CDP-6-deoxy-D-xylo-4-hexulose-3-dehydrase
MMDWPLMKNSIDEEQKQAMIDFINTTGKFTNGEKVKEFEEKWSEWLGVDYSVYVNSGGSANLLLLNAVAELFFKDKSKKTEHGHNSWVVNSAPRVLVPSCTWGTTIAPLMQCGYDIAYCDIDLNSYSFLRRDMEKIAAEDKRIDVVWITHLLGSPSNIDLIKEIFPDAMIIEDCCESHGARWDGQKVGTFGEGSTFSFYFGHHMTTVEGGIVSTNNKDLYELMRMKRSHGLARELSPEAFDKVKKEYPNLDERFLFPTAGYNLRNVEINAVIGMKQLNHLDDWIGIRMANLYLFNLMLLKYGDYFIPPVLEGNSSFAFPFVCKTPELKKGLEEHLAANGIETRPFLVGNILKQPFINHPDAEGFLNAEYLHNNAFYIGNNQYISNEDMRNLELLVAEYFASRVKS